MAAESLVAVVAPVQPDQGPPGHGGPIAVPPAGVPPEGRAVRLLGSPRKLWINRASPMAKWRMGIINELSRRGRPVQLTVEPRADDWSEITDANVAYVMRVRDLQTLPSGDVAVSLRPSVASYVLRRDSPRFQDQLGLLTRAYENRAAEGTEMAYVVVVKGNIPGELADVQPLQGPVLAFSSCQPLPLPQTFKTEEEIRSLVTVLPDLNTAKQLFNAMAALGCDPADIQGECTPFAFPEDGCHVRAHQMCERLLVDHGIVAAKVWVYPSDTVLKPKTTNDPQCEVSWKYHVAPAVRVKVGTKKVWRVIDPSLFGATAALPTIAKWKKRQEDPQAFHEFTEAALFDRPPQGPSSVDWDPAFCYAPEKLAEYRAALYEQIKNEQGKLPPYCS